MRILNEFINLYIINGQEVRDYCGYEYFGINNYHMIGADENNNRSDVISKEVFTALTQGKDLDQILTASEFNELQLSLMRMRTGESIEI